MNKTALVIYHLGFAALLLYAALHRANGTFIYVILLFLFFEFLLLRKRFREKRPYGVLSFVYLAVAFGMAWYRMNIAPGVESDVHRSIAEHGFVAPFVIYLLFNYFSLPPFEDWPRKKTLLATFIGYNIIGLLNESIQSLVVRGTIMPHWIEDTFVDLAINLIVSAILLLPWLYLKNPFANEAEEDNQ